MIPLVVGVLSQGPFCPPHPIPHHGYLVMSGDSFGFLNWDGAAIIIQWAEARDATEYPTMHRTALPQQM